MGVCTLIVFTRWPTPGLTKTRLIPSYGALGAANIHRQLLARTVVAVGECQMRNDIVAAIADIPSNSDVASLIPSSWVYFGQRGADLGERMANAIDDAFQLRPRSTSAVLIGVDCPDYCATLFDRAASVLNTHDVVYAPTEDGGYGLVGVARSAWNSRTRSAMFKEIVWGTSSVFASSRERLSRVRHASQQRSVAVATLPTIWDVDTANDVARAIALGLLNDPTVHGDASEK